MECQKIMECNITHEWSMESDGKVVKFKRLRSELFHPVVYFQIKSLTLNQLIAHATTVLYCKKSHVYLSTIFPR